MSDTSPRALGRPCTLALLAAALLTTGCNGSWFNWKGGPGSGDAAAPWQIKPVGVRIHPSTRLTPDAGRIALEARIEFVDDVGDPIKAAGDLRFDLFPPVHSGEAASGKPLYSWQTSILTRADNQRQYDAVTSGYLFRLKLDDPAIARQPLHLRVTFQPPDGQRLEVEQDLANAPGAGATSGPAAP
jgi:hypothetical protein